jgi:hypothetical protein
MAHVGTVNEVLDGHVVLDLECLDRIDLNADVPTLQVGGQVVTFFTRHRDQPIASPGLFAQLGDAFRQVVAAFADRHQIPVVRFGKHDRQLDLIRPYCEAATRAGVVAIGVAQEFQSVLTAYDRSAKAPGPRRPGAPHYGFVTQDRRVSGYYFSIADAEFGLTFIKRCSSFPYPGKVWVNGHVRHEALRNRAEMKGLRCRAVAAVR